MKRLLAVVCGALVSAASVYAVATISWQTEAGQQVLRDSSTNFLTAGASNTTGFIQLIYLGPNNAFDSFTNYFLANSTGIAGDDKVVGTAWVGSGFATKTQNDGKFQMFDTSNTNAIGSRFVIRFFSQPSPNYSLGYVPTSGYFGFVGTGQVNNVSGAFISTQDPNAAIAVDLFELQQFAGTTYAIIPEPATLLFALAGIGAMIYRRFRK